MISRGFVLIVAYLYLYFNVIVIIVAVVVSAEAVSGVCGIVVKAAAECATNIQHPCKQLLWQQKNESFHIKLFCQWIHSVIIIFSFFILLFYKSY